MITRYISICFLIKTRNVFCSLFLLFLSFSFNAPYKICMQSTLLCFKHSNFCSKIVSKITLHMKRMNWKKSCVHLSYILLDRLSILLKPMNKILRKLKMLIRRQKTIICAILSCYYQALGGATRDYEAHINLLRFLLFIL